MSYVCHYCDKETEQAHSITVYDVTGAEDRYEVLCPSCYTEWLLSMKG
jgi:hypothetical protein